MNEIELKMRKIVCKVKVDINKAIVSPIHI
jgi:hypothetical protein